MLFGSGGTGIPAGAGIFGGTGRNTPCSLLGIDW